MGRTPQISSQSSAAGVLGGIEDVELCRLSLLLRPLYSQGALESLSPWHPRTARLLLSVGS